VKYTSFPDLESPPLKTGVNYPQDYEKKLTKKFKVSKDTIFFPGQLALHYLESSFKSFLVEFVPKVYQDLQKTHQELLNEHMALEEKLFIRNEREKYDAYSNVQTDEQYSRLKELVSSLRNSTVNNVHNFHEKASKFQEQIIQTSSKFAETIEIINSNFKQFSSLELHIQFSKANEM
jgi:hypothetical protein